MRVKNIIVIKLIMMKIDVNNEEKLIGIINWMDIIN